MGTGWIKDDEAAALLDGSGEPFNRPEYRRAWTEAAKGWTDVSFGARMHDGTQAAVALLRGIRAADSLPLGYGGIVASRALDAQEVSSFLRAARRSARAVDLQTRSVPINPPAAQLHAAGRVVAWTSVLYLDANSTPESRLTTKVRQTIRRAHRAGGSARPVSDDPEPFLRLYDRASEGWSMRYPGDVLRHLAESGLLGLYYAELEGSVEASAVALRGERHWMYWLGAQSEAGRAAELGYVAVAALVADAQDARTGAVNLGASAGLPGVATFKRRFGGIEVPVIGHRSRRPLLAGARVAAIHTKRSLDFAARR